MVTDLQFYNAVRSYNYRTNLFESINELEEKIVKYMVDKKLTKALIPGYHVDISDNKVVVTEKPVSDLDQLCFEFYKDLQDN